MNDDGDFVRAIAADPGNGTLRLVYADWLEERGDPRAEFLRLEQALADPPDLEFYRHHLEERRAVIRVAVDPLHYLDWLEQEGGSRAECVSIEDEMRRVDAEEQHWFELRARFRELTQTLDRRWLAMLDRAPVENCAVRFRFQCPKQWQGLQLTEDAAVRFCTSCRKNVYHCGSVDEAHAHARAGHCVAVDSRLPREPEDLEEEVGLVMGDFHLPELEETSQRRRPWWHVWARAEAPEIEDSDFVLGLMDVDEDEPEAEVRKAWWRFW